MAKTVLLVDYDPRSFARIRTELAKLGLRIVLAHDGKAAEKEFQRELPDLTLVQDLLPGKLGYQVCCDLKETPAGAQSPILLLGRLRNGGRYKVSASRCDDWIETPVDEKSLRDKVLKYLPGAAPSASV